MLLEPLFVNAARSPDVIAFTDDFGQTSYRQLAGGAVALSQVITKATPAKSVGILLPSSAAFATAFYAALLAGKVVVPINFLLEPRQIAHVIQDAGVDLVITAPPLSAKFELPGVKTLDLSTLPKVDPASIQMPTSLPQTDVDALSLLLYTSGTSGLPKGVRLSQRNFATCVQACIDHAFRSHPEVKFLGLVPLFHSLGLTATLLIPMKLGAPVVYQARFNPSSAMKAIVEQACSIVIAVPPMYRAMMAVKEAGPATFARTHLLICGGEPLPASIRDAFERRFGVKLREGYGLSETCGPIAVNTIDAERPGSVGRPIPGSRVRVVDANNVEQPPGSPGEVLLGGPTVFAGYNNLEDETRRAIENGFFRTGDLGLIDSDGFLHITGRAKELIILAGEKMHPREIEEPLMQHDSVAEAAVIGIRDDSRGEMVVAFVVTRDGSEPDANALRSFLRDAGVPAWKHPRRFVAVRELPRSPTGKVLRRELAEHLSR